MNTNEYLTATREVLYQTGDYSCLEGRRRMKLADGFEMSVQASGMVYCAPRDDNGPYTHVEIGYPSSKEELIMEWAENEDEPTGTVYGYVPVEIVDAVIEKHGGIVIEEAQPDTDA